MPTLLRDMAADAPAFLGLVALSGIVIGCMVVLQ